MNMYRRTAAALAMSLALAGAATAHEVTKGPHGGSVAHAGSIHAELLANGTTSVTLYLLDADAKPMPATGYKGNAILVVGGKSQRFALTATDSTKLVGTAPVPVRPGVKGAIQLTAPDGSTTQAKF